MALIRSEISSYKDIVSAIDREIHGRGQKEITWDTFMHEDKISSPHSVVVGRVSDELKQMNFMSSFTYDKEHLLNSMFPEDSRAPHAHGMSIDEMLRLPQLLNHPVAIVTERDGKIRDTGDGEFKCLHFLCSFKEDGEQKYYRAIVQPQAHHNGLLVSGYASKVVTYHKVTDGKFFAMLNGALNGDREMLYFNNKRFLKIDSPYKPIELYDHENKAISINGYFTRDPELRRISQEHQHAIQRAATAEMNKLIIGKSTRGESFPIFNSSVKALAHGSSFETIKSAHKDIQRMSTLTMDRVLAMRTREYADKSFARSYTRLMTPEIQQDYIEKAVERIGRINVNSQMDLENLCNEIEDATSKIPTLSNLKINFADNLANVRIIMDARQVSGQLQVELEQKLAKILMEKTTELDKKLGRVSTFSSTDSHNINGQDSPNFDDGPTL